MIGMVTFLAACDETRKPPKEFAYYLEEPSPMRLIEVISGRSNNERREIVKRTLEHASIAYAEVPFERDGYKGANIHVDIGAGREMLVFLAHFDGVPNSPAANDNASCVSAGIEALRTLKPVPRNLTLRFIFTDAEEYGLLGAREYVEKTETENVIGAVSYEMCGIGDAFGIWDVYGDAENAEIVKTLKSAGRKLGLYHGTHGKVPRFSSDHRAFADVGIEAVGVTFLPKRDEEKLRDYVENPNNPIWMINYVRPTIFQTYHTSDDGPETIETGTLDLVVKLMKEAVNVASLKLN